jgi:Ca-activated chloride channel family protein
MGRRDVRTSTVGRRALGAALALAAVALAAVAAAACAGSGERDAGDAGDTSAAGDPVELRVLAGSELADLEPVLADAADATGVSVTLDFVGTLEGVEQVVAGETDGRFDAVWFSSNRYLSLHPEAAGRIRAESRIMTSPVILGLSATTARELGWADRTDVTWSDIATAAAQRRFTYGMTNPAASNSGFSALVGVAAALSGTGAALEQPDIDAAAPELRGFFSAQMLTAGSSGWLADAYAARSRGEQPGPVVDGLINYESVLLSLNDDDTLGEPLTLVYPADGVVTADYPLTLLDSAPEGVRRAYQRLVDHLLRPDVQADIMRRTHRRPAATGVEPDERFGSATLVELPFPAKLDVVDGLIGTYFERLRRPVRTVYVLDVSGSMDGDRIEALKTALIGLTGADDTLTSRSRQFHSREEITLLPFDDASREPESFVVPEDGADQARAEIRAAAEGLETGGNTAVYDTLIGAYDLLRGAPRDDVATSIVLMTDGENNAGATLDYFVDHHRDLPEGLRTVPVFVVLFGESNIDEMEHVAEITGGRSFDARASGLEAAFREIRGYQ